MEGCTERQTNPCPSVCEVKSTDPIHGGDPPIATRSTSMSDIANIAGTLGSSRVPVSPRSESTDRPIEARSSTRHGRGSDAVEISADARLLGEIRSNSDSRPDLEKIARIRAEIETGSYDSEARFQIAVNQLSLEIA